MIEGRWLWMRCCVSNNGEPTVEIRRTDSKGQWPGGRECPYVGGEEKCEGYKETYGES